MREQRAFVLFTLVVGYGAFYLCRANVESSFPLLAAEFHFTKAQLGTLSSAAIIVYSVGKVVMGPFGDVIGGKRLMLVAAFGSVLATLAFGASSTLGAFIVFAAASRFFQSGGWSGAVSVVSQWFEPRRHGAVMGVMATSYELGNVLTILLCSAVTRVLPGWRPLYVINPLLFAAAALFVAVALRPAPPDAGEGAQEDGKPGRGEGRTHQALPSSRLPVPNPPATLAPATAVPRESLGAIVEALARKPAFWVAVALSVLLTFLRVGFLTWTPTYLYEIAKTTGQQAVSASIAKSAIFSSAGVVSALGIGALSDRFGPGRRAPVMAASLAVVVVLVLWLAHGPVRSSLQAAFLIGGVGLFLLGPYSLLAGALALDVSGKRGAATAAGIIDGAGYVAGSASGIVLGTLADERGWSAAFDVLAAAAIAATIVSGLWAVVVMRRRA